MNRVGERPVCPAWNWGHFRLSRGSLFRERAHPEHGGIRYTHWWYGVWGVSILLAVATGVTYGALHGWLRRLPPVVLQVPAPTIPTITTSQVANPIQADTARKTKALKSPPKTGASEAHTPNTTGQLPSQSSPLTGQSPPATFLDRVVQENRGLTPDDRNRLSTELYDCDQFIKQSQAVGYKLNTEFGKLSNDRQSGVLAKNVDDHIKFFRDLDTSAWSQYHGLQHLQEKWQYFPDQTEYVFGDNPFNAGVGMLVNVAEGMAARSIRGLKFQTGINMTSSTSRRNSKSISKRICASPLIGPAEHFNESNR